MATLQLIPLAAIRAARIRIAKTAITTPLVRLDVDDAPAEIYVKLENLQPVGSVKIRGAGNALGVARPEQLASGVWTASTGNMARGVAWVARRLGVHCRTVAPDTVLRSQLAAVEKLGAEIVRVPEGDWWRLIRGRVPNELPGLFVHPVYDPTVIAGHGTVGLEVAEQLADIDTVLVPFGGGGLACGIASALRFLQPKARVFGCEVTTAAPLQAAWEAGRPREIETAPSFVDGIGSKSVLEPMWPLVKDLLAGSLAVSPEQVAAAVRLLAERARVVVEGAGAVAVAAALAGLAGEGKVVCVVSGGNVDLAPLAQILRGETPATSRMIS
jgi:threonine dehydratase